MTQTHHMNQIEIQARLKYPKIKTATQFTIDSYTKIENKVLKNHLNNFYRLKCLEQHLNQIKNVKTARQHEQEMNNMKIRTQTEK